MPGDRRLPARTPDGEPWPAEAGALLIKGMFNLDTEAGRTAHANAKFYAEDAAYSIGYKVTPTGARMRGGLRYVTDLDVFEVSQVLHGAHPWARGLPPEVKHRPGQLEVKAMPVRARRRRVPLGELDRMRHERIRRDVARWERE